MANRKIRTLKDLPSGWVEEGIELFRKDLQDGECIRIKRVDGNRPSECGWVVAVYWTDGTPSHGHFETSWAKIIQHITPNQTEAV